jgi:ribonuclease D
VARGLELVSAPVTEPLIHLLTDLPSLQRGLASMRGRVAIDTEFHSEHVYYPRLHLVQLRGEDGPALLVDPHAISDLRSLGKLLEGRTLLIHSASHDLSILRRAVGLNPKPEDVIDPQILAGFVGMGFPRSLTDLSRELLGEDLPPSSSMSDWSKRPLTEEQRRYAAMDVLHLHALTDALERRLAGRPQLRWARACAAEINSAALHGEDPELLWRRIPGAAVLDGRGRAALRSLVIWREATAIRNNQPRFQIASDGSLLDVARRAPTTLAELSQNRRLPRRLAKDQADEVMAALNVAAALPEEALPPPVITRGAAARADALLAAWAHIVEEREGVAAELLLPPDLRREIAVRWTRREEIAITGWRSEAIGEELINVLNGKIGLFLRA